MYHKVFMFINEAIKLTFTFHLLFKDWKYLGQAKIEQLASMVNCWYKYILMAFS